MKITTKNSTGGSSLGKIVAGIAIVAVVLWFFGWGDGVVTPNVRVSCRESVVPGGGYVLQVCNSGSKPLFNLSVGNDNWTEKHLLAKQLDVGSTVEAGWWELGEGIKPGYT